MRHRVGGFAAVLLLVAGCVSPTTRLPPVDPELIRVEEERQRVLAIATLAEQQTRLERIAWPILTRAVSLCDEAPGYGIRFGTAHVYDDTWLPAAREVFGISDTLTVVGVVPGSPADSADLRVGDLIVFAQGFSETSGPRSAEAFAGFLQDQAAAGSSVLDLRLRREGQGHELRLEAVDACPYGVAVIPDGTLNAFADGQNVYVTSAMMRFAEDDELAVIVGHELAHNAMGHIEASSNNALAAGLLGLIFDVALMSQGINTGGLYTSDFAQLGAMTFSQDFEREADYVGLYAIALAGYPLAQAPTFWRHMAIADPGSIELAISHPTTAERFVRLEQAIAEIEAKRARGEPLHPEMEDD